ncbi:MAG: HNH endonuclease [Myxococcales bacterium]|nr:HNH endonuclease [Myxococcales bacterium]
MAGVRATARRQIELRHSGHCGAPGCSSSAFTHVHHVTPRADGGTHDPEELVLLCDAHHWAVHDGALLVTGRFSEDFVFRYSDGRPYGSAPRSPHACAVMADAFATLQRERTAVEQRAARGSPNRQRTAVVLTGSRALTIGTMATEPDAGLRSPHALAAPPHSIDGPPRYHLGLYAADGVRLRGGPAGPSMVVGAPGLDRRQRPGSSGSAGRGRRSRRRDALSAGYLQRRRGSPPRAAGGQRSRQGGSRFAGPFEVWRVWPGLRGGDRDPIRGSRMELRRRGDGRSHHHHHLHGGIRCNEHVRSDGPHRARLRGGGARLPARRVALQSLVRDPPTRARVAVRHVSRRGIASALILAADPFGLLLPRLPALGRGGSAVLPGRGTPGGARHLRRGDARSGRSHAAARPVVRRGPRARSTA